MKKIERFEQFLTQKIDFESQILALFDASPLHQFSKFNNFLCVCSFVSKNLSNLYPPTRKLDNLYYHILYFHVIHFFLEDRSYSIEHLCKLRPRNKERILQRKISVSGNSFAAGFHNILPDGNLLMYNKNGTGNTGVSEGEGGSFRQIS